MARNPSTCASLCQTNHRAPTVPFAALVEVEGEAMRPVTRTVIEEVRSGDWANGGKPLSTADVKALAAAPAPAVAC